jgi:hypothetical protein
VKIIRDMTEPNHLRHAQNVTACARHIKVPSARAEGAPSITARRSHLARYAAGVSLLVRGSSLSAMSDYLVKQLERTDNLSIRFKLPARARRG